MNTQEVEVNDEIIIAIRAVCYFLKHSKKENIVEVPTDIWDSATVAGEWANNVIIGDDVPF